MVEADGGRVEAVTAADERKHAEISELIGLLREHSGEIDNELADDGRPRHTWLVIDAAKRLRDVLARRIMAGSVRTPDHDR